MRHSEIVNSEGPERRSWLFSFGTSVGSEFSLVAAVSDSGTKLSRFYQGFYQPNQLGGFADNSRMDRLGGADLVFLE